MSVGLKGVGAVAGCSLGTEESGTQREVGRVREPKRPEGVGREGRVRSRPAFDL